MARHALNFTLDLADDFPSYRVFLRMSGLVWKDIQDIWSGGTAQEYQHPKFRRQFD